VESTQSTRLGLRELLHGVDSTRSALRCPPRRQRQVSTSYEDQIALWAAAVTDVALARHDASVVDLRLRPMTRADFDGYWARAACEYAAENVKAGTWGPDDAPARADEQLARLLPDGRHTADTLLLIAEDPAGEQVGVLWISLRHPGGVADTGWIFDIQVVPDRRGQGLGRALLVAAEEEVRRHGIGRLGLNVLGANEVARALYDSTGYQVVALQMAKQL